MTIPDFFLYQCIFGSRIKIWNPFLEIASLYTFRVITIILDVEWAYHSSEKHSSKRSLVNYYTFINTLIWYFALYQIKYIIFMTQKQGGDRQKRISESYSTPKNTYRYLYKKKKPPILRMVIWKGLANILLNIYIYIKLEVKHIKWNGNLWCKWF